MKTIARVMMVLVMVVLAVSSVSGWEIRRTQGNLIDDPISMILLSKGMPRETSLGIMWSVRSESVLVVLLQDRFVGLADSRVSTVIATDLIRDVRLNSTVAGNSTKMVAWGPEDSDTLVGLFTSGREVMIRIRASGGNIDVTFRNDPDALKAALAELGWD